MTRYYNIEPISILLIEGFSEAELRSFCFYHLEFRDVYYQLSENSGKSQIVHQLVEYADRRELFKTLLYWAKEKNPAKYEKHKPYWSNSPSTRSIKNPKTSKITEVLLQQALKEIEEIKELIEEDLDKAVRRWWDYKQVTVNPDNDSSIWLDPNLQNKLDDLWTYEIKDSDWQAALLKKAITNFQKDDKNEAIDRAELIDQISPGNRSNGAISAKFFIAYVKRDNQQIVKVAQEFGANKAVKAIWWLYNFDDKFSIIVRPVIVKTLSLLAGQSDVIEPVYPTLHDSIDGQNLLKDPNFQPSPLEKLASESFNADHRELAHKLLLKRRIDYEWPPFWPDGSNYASRHNSKTTDWLQEIVSNSLSHDPFEFWHAELEPNLFNYLIEPSFLKSNIPFQHQPVGTILFAEQGGGKTTVAFVLIREQWTKKPDITGKKFFPVYFPLSLDTTMETTTTFYIDILVKALGKALVDFLILNPYAFLDHHKNQKTAIATLLTYRAGSADNLEIHLKQTPLSNHSAGNRLLEQMIQRSSSLSPDIDWMETLQEQTLQQARPLGFSHTCIFVDLTVGDQFQKTSPLTAKHLQPLLDLMLRLTHMKTYLTLLVPLHIRKNIIFPRGILIDTITWTPAELEEVVGSRLSEASKGQIVSLSQLFSHDVLEEDITELVRAAGNSPGLLFKMINQLIKLQANKIPFSKIDIDTLETVLKSARFC